MKKIILSSLLLFSITTNAAVWFEPRMGVWFGNICQTPVGWQIVQAQPVGSVCFAPAVNTYGFIANR